MSMRGGGLCADVSCFPAIPFFLLPLKLLATTLLTCDFSLSSSAAAAPSARAACAWTASCAARQLRVKFDGRGTRERRKGRTETFHRSYRDDSIDDREVSNTRGMDTEKDTLIPF